jgi:hypothetical protein
MCGYAVAKQHFFKKFQTAEKIVIEDMQMRSNILSSKMCKYAVAEVLPANCGIANEGRNKVAHAHLCKIVS